MSRVFYKPHLKDHYKKVYVFIASTWIKISVDIKKQNSVYFHPHQPQNSRVSPLYKRGNMVSRLTETNAATVLKEPTWLPWLHFQQASLNCGRRRSTDDFIKTSTERETGRSLKSGKSEFNLRTWARSGCTPAWISSCCTGSPGPACCDPESFVSDPAGSSPRSVTAAAAGSAGSPARLERGPVLPRTWCRAVTETSGSCSSLFLCRRGLRTCWGTGLGQSSAWGWSCCRWRGRGSGSWGCGSCWAVRGRTRCWRTGSFCGRTNPTPGTWRRCRLCSTAWRPPGWTCSTRCPSADRRPAAVGP